jgi:hypothetical protein
VEDLVIAVTKAENEHIGRVWLMALAELQRAMKFLQGDY